MSFEKELEKSDNDDLELTSIGKRIDMVLISDFQFIIQIIKAMKSSKIVIHKEFGLLELCLEIFVPPPIYNLLHRFNIK